MTSEWFIASRYLWSKRRHPFVGVMSTISVIGIAVGVAALIVVLGVMNGFDEELEKRIIGMRAHIFIEKENFDDWEGLQEKLNQIKALKAAAPYIEGQAVLQAGEWGSGVLVRGIDPVYETKVTLIGEYLKKGALLPKVQTVVIGEELARKIGTRAGDSVSLLTQSLDRPMKFEVAGIFSSGMYEYDANVIFVGLTDAQTLFRAPGRVSGLSVALQNPYAAESIKATLKTKLPYPYTIKSWIDMNKNLFGALALEKFAMFVILSLIVLVACLNIGGSLTVMVMDKTKDIGILKSLGMNTYSVQRIFALNGLLIGSMGAFFGLALGLLICFLLKHYSFIELPADVYYMTKIPVQSRLSDVFLILGSAVALSFISSIYPARMAGRLDIVKALRYE